MPTIEREDLITRNLRVERIVFYDKESKWGVIAASPKEVNEDNSEILNKYGNITVTGNMDGIYEGALIFVEGQIINNDKYGKQISAGFVKVLADDKSKEGIVNFLTKSHIKGISTQNAKKIYEEFREDSIETVLHSPYKLIKIRGIASKTIEKVADSVTEYLKHEGFYKYCSKLGIEYSLQRKLLEEFGDEAFNIIQLDPFKILEVSDDFSFNVIDNIYLENGGSPTGTKRLNIGLIYSLKHLAVLEGSTGCSKRRLDNAFYKLLKLDSSRGYFETTLLTLKGLGKIIEDSNIVYLKEYTDTERYIATSLISLDNNSAKCKSIDEKVIEEEIKNFPFTLNEEQERAVHACLCHKVSVLTGAGGCVDCDTEYFNGEKWIPISEYKAGDQVLQYNADGTAEMVNPLKYIKLPCKELTQMKNYYGTINQVLSDEHKVVYLSTKGNINEKPFSAIKDLINRKRGFNAYIISNFKIPHEIPASLTEDRLRLLIAISADGSLLPSGNFWRIRLKKQRKIERLKNILSNIGLDIEEKIYIDGYSNFNIPFEYGCKEFPPSFYFLPKNLKKVFCEEILYWDGSTRVGNRSVQQYYTTSKNNADLVQFLWAQGDTRVSLLVDDRVGQKHKGNEYTYKSITYRVCKTKTKKVSLTRDPRRSHNMLYPYKTKDGFKYCFTVPSGMLVLRRNNNIFITGNSGKSSITKALFRIYERSGYQVILLSPTAKACRRLEECTGGIAQTIHKFLGMTKDSSEGESFEYAPNTVIIVDEASMLDVILCKNLVANATPTTKFLFVGDNNQLPSVQIGNVLGDLIDSGRIHVSLLTDVVRQAENSNIIKYCTMINKGEVIDPCEHEDFIYEEFEHAEELRDKFLPLYLEEVKNNGLNEVQVIAPYKAGEIGMNNLNLQLQMKYNKNPEIEGYEPYRIGDRVRHTKNNYKKEVFNGETGIIKEVTVDFLNEDDSNLIVDYGNKEIEYNKDDINELTLSYASTVHASQGSEYKVVFVILDDTSVNDFLHIRRLLYTAVSRGKKKVYIFTKPYLVDKCIQNDSYRPRVTKLKDYLREN